MLLEQGALCERDTFQGERCLYSALNDRLRNLLLSYEFTKSTDPLQPYAGHINGLLLKEVPKTSDITVYTESATFELHKFVLSARSPYFTNKLSAAPDTKTWRLSSNVPSKSFETCVRYLYLGEAALPPASNEEEQAEMLAGVDKLSRQLEIPQLLESILHSGDRRQRRQRRSAEVERGRDQVAAWFEANVLRHRLEVDREKAEQVKWDRDNGIFADVMLLADEAETDEEDDDTVNADVEPATRRQETASPMNAIPIGTFHTSQSRSPSRIRRARRTTLFPAHRAMLLRSDYFATMFSSPFREGQELDHLQIVPVDCSNAVLEVILTFIYTEKADFPLSLALDVLHAADMLFIEKLKQRAALLISTLGNGSASVVEADNSRGTTTEPLEAEAINVYDVIRAGWDTRVHRLEEFGARYIAYRLERYIDELEFRELVTESASRIEKRQETDTVELIDDIRWYLSERFRLRFEDAGLDEMMDEDAQHSDDKVEDEGVNTHSGLTPPRDADEADEGYAPDLEFLESQGVVRTLDGDIAGDEFAQDAMNYQILLGKIETMMEELGLDG